jgi:hypothetical protein
MPIGSLRPTSRRRSNRYRPRVVFLVAVTALTLLVLFGLSRRGSGTESTSSRTRVESKSTARHATTTVVTSTTVYDVALNPEWPAKGTSRFSDSAASKSLGDQLGASSTTTASSGGASTATSIGSIGRHTASTLAHSTVTTLRNLPTTSRAVTHATQAPVTTAPVVTTPPTTAPPVTEPPATTPATTPTQ